MITGFADENCHIAGSDIRYAGYIHKHLIHTDAADDRSFLVVYQNLPMAAGECPWNPVSISNGKNSNLLFFLCLILKTISDSFPSMQIFGKRDLSFDR